MEMQGSYIYEVKFYNFHKLKKVLRIVSEKQFHITKIYMPPS